MTAKANTTIEQRNDLTDGGQSDNWLPEWPTSDDKAVYRVSS